MNRRFSIRFSLFAFLVIFPAVAIAQVRVATLPATSVTATGATLNGTVNPGGAPANVSFQYGTTTAYGTTVNAVPSLVDGSSNVSVSAAITGLTPGTTYHYRTVASQNGRDAYGPDVTFTTSAGSTTATTNAASGISPTGATLNGTVFPNNLSTTVTFEYGTTTAYGTTVTADQSPVSGTTNVAVTRTLTGLTPNTTYHYRVVAANSGGTVYGSDMTFTTDVSPTATTNAATGITAVAATLNGTVNGNNISTTVTFEYGTTVAYGTTVTADQSPLFTSTDTAVSRDITGLAVGTTYHYRVVATSFAGTTYGADMTFATSSNPPPTVVTGAASSITNTTAVLNGTVNANGTSTTVTFEFGPTPSYGRTFTADQSPVTGSTNTAVSVSVSGLIPGTTYHYRVVGANAGGTANGSDMTFTTDSLPTATTNTASNTSATGATLNGTVNANNASTTVTFEYGTTTAYGTTVTADQSPVTGTTDTAVSRAITGLTPGTTYHYRVVGQNAFGTTNGGDMTFIAVDPTTATTGAATDITQISATLTGTVNPNGLSTTVTFEYGLDTSYSRSISADPSAVNGIGDTPVNGYVTGLMPGNTYHYRVVATNVNGTVYGADRTFSTLPTSLSITDADITEGDSGTTIMTFTVSLSNPVNQVVTVQYHTVDVTAAAGPDYVATAGTLSFPISTTSQPIQVTINSDTTPEADETFHVVLSNPANADILDGTGTGRILTDDYLQITATSSPNGSILPSGVVEVEYGRNKTFIMRADEGYRVSDILVDGMSVGSNTQHTFENVTNNHTIHAVFDVNEPPVIDSLTADPIAGNAVLDVTANAVAYDPDGGDIVQYQWAISGRRTDATVTREPTLAWRFVLPGEYQITLTVVDQDGGVSAPASVDIHVAETAPIAFPLPTVLDFDKVRAKADLDVAVRIINVFDEAATITLDALDEEGLVLESRDLMVPPYGTAPLSTDWITDPDTVSVRATADRYVVVTGKLTGINRMMTAYLDTDFGAVLTVPHIAEEMAYWDTLVYLSNSRPDLLDAQMAGTITSLEPHASQVMDMEMFLDEDPFESTAWGQLMAHASDAFSSPATLTGFEMFLTNDADGAAVELQHKASQMLYIPHIPEETDLFWTGFAIVNPGDTDADALFYWYDDEGNLLGSSPVLIESGTKFKGRFDFAFPEFGETARWGMVMSDQPLMGVEIFGAYSGGICGLTLPGSARTHGILPELNNAEGTWSGFAVTNAMPDAVTVTFELVGTDGVVKDSRSESIAGLSRFKAVVGDYFSASMVEAGDYVRFTATGPVVAIGITGDDGRTVMSALTAAQ